MPGEGITARSAMSGGRRCAIDYPARAAVQAITHTPADTRCAEGPTAWRLASRLPAPLGAG